MASLYRIAADADWRAAEKLGVFRGAAHDQRDGFVHLSAPHQVEGTLAAHYAGVRGLVLLTIDGDRLASQLTLKWEPSRGGELFPHLYEPLPVALVTGVAPLPVDAAGKHVLPAELRPPT
jgi:uncharacterized protein (DUF952 family)